MKGEIVNRPARLANARLRRSQPTVYLTVRVPALMKERFIRACKKRGATQTEAIRLLVDAFCKEVAKR